MWLNLYLSINIVEMESCFSEISWSESMAVCCWSEYLKQFEFFLTYCLQISLRPAQSFLMNKNQVPKLQPQITMIPPSAQPPRTQTPPLGQVNTKNSCILLAILTCLCLENLVSNVGGEREVFDCTEQYLGKECVTTN